MPAMLFRDGTKSIAGMARSYRYPGNIMDAGPRLPCLTFTRYTAGTGA